MSLNGSATTQGNTVSLPDFVANLTVMFQKGYMLFEDRFPSAKMLYNVDNIGGGVGTTRRVEEPTTGFQPARVKAQGQPYYVNTIAPGYYKDISVTEKGSMITWTWFLDYHDKYKDASVYNWYKNIGDSLRRRFEFDAIFPFGFGTATTYTDLDGTSNDISTGDSLSLWNTAHTLTYSTNTYRNRLANNPALAVGSIEAMQTMAYQNVQDNNGNRMLINLDSIAVGSSQSNYNQALRIVRSMAPVDALNSNVFNPQEGAFRVYRFMFLDANNIGTPDSAKVNYWFMFDSTIPGAWIVVSLEPTVTVPTISNDGINFATDNMMVKGHGCWQMVMLDPRPYAFSSGDGTA